MRRPEPLRRMRRRCRQHQNTCSGAVVQAYSHQAAFLQAWAPGTMTSKQTCCACMMVQRAVQHTASLARDRQTLWQRAGCVTRSGRRRSMRVAGLQRPLTTAGDTVKPRRYKVAIGAMPLTMVIEISAADNIVISAGQMTSAPGDARVVKPPFQTIRTIMKDVGGGIDHIIPMTDAEKSGMAAGGRRHNDGGGTACRTAYQTTVGARRGNAATCAPCRATCSSSREPLSAQS
jgi:hypothetical protein